jgi:hypothetical protein
VRRNTALSPGQIKLLKEGLRAQVLADEKLDGVAANVAKLPGLLTRE